MEAVKCPVCGKEFIPATENIYKASIKGRTKHLCSWTCYRKIQRAKEAKKKRE